MHKKCPFDCGELSEILGLNESELSAIEHADLTKALSSYQLEKMAELCDLQLGEMLNIDYLYEGFDPDSYHDDEDGDPRLEWNDEYVGEYDDLEGRPIVLKVWEVNEMEHRYGGLS